jgi:CrcB protein
VQRQQTSPREPVDSDVDLHLGRPTRHRASDAILLAVIAVGCAIGTSARYPVGEACLTPQGHDVLGGHTTFSTYTVDIQHLIANRHSGIALLYSAVTAAGALNAVWVTATATRDQVNRRMR